MVYKEDNMIPIPLAGTTNGLHVDPITLADKVGAITVAVMYNYYNPALINSSLVGISTSSQNRVILNPYIDPVNCINDISYSNVMAMDSFLNLFYPTIAGYFNINLSNANNPAIILSSQTFSSNIDDNNKFSLYQYIIRCYCAEKGIIANNIDPRILILLKKEVMAVQSLADIRGNCISLSWNEVIGSLVDSEIIVANDLTGIIAPVPLQIVLNFHSFTLDIDVKVVMTYIVGIEGYSLIEQIV